MDSKDRCIERIRQYTRHDNVKLTNSGDGAIFAALHIAREEGYREVLIPDQGGWLTYPQYPLLLGMKVTEIDTNQGLIKPESLAGHGGKAVIVPSYAGYFAEQNLAMIGKACNENGLLLIEDASGAIGSKTLCDGQISDIIVGSFGKDKIVNNGHGGFISVRHSKLFSHSASFSLTKPNGIDYEALALKLEMAPVRLTRFIELNRKVKDDLRDMDVLHKDREGINAAIGFASEDEKTKIIKYCTENGFQYTVCPRYIRVLRQAISIEIKRQET